MIKITLFISLAIIASVAFASSLSCQSCGAECAPACGTRRFRSCCFNYLRRKRGDDKVLYPHHGFRKEIGNQRPAFVDDSELWSIVTNDYKPSYLDNMIENALQTEDA
ncbi:U-scoloptoxin(20)-Cw1a-like [Bicyclus anynana]|uniref:U-scoloptoxin(20)-Cw1a-like n=1 Tax=Bicyclus anynana TaxID=110368 RepID=A0A6J1MY67_BICAN|nr:U-scoloptoxin(20)-Cw1a-like [Bicyclus anynana]